MAAALSGTASVATEAARKYGRTPFPDGNIVVRQGSVAIASQTEAGDWFHILPIYKGETMVMCNLYLPAMQSGTTAASIILMGMTTYAADGTGTDDVDAFGTYTSAEGDAVETGGIIQFPAAVTETLAGTAAAGTAAAQLDADNRLVAAPNDGVIRLELDTISGTALANGVIVAVGFFTKF